MLKSDIKEDAAYLGGLPTHGPRLVTEIKNDSVTFRLRSSRTGTGWTRIQYVTTLGEFADWARELSSESYN